MNGKGRMKHGWAGMAGAGSEGRGNAVMGREKQGWVGVGENGHDQAA